MNNLKKIGMTALAASLVSTSVFAGEVTVAGGASMTMLKTILDAIQSKCMEKVSQWEINLLSQVVEN